MPTEEWSERWNVAGLGDRESTTWAMKWDQPQDDGKDKETDSSLEPPQK